VNKKKIIGGVITLSSLALLAACSPQDSENQESVDTSVQSSIPAAESSSESQMMSESEGMDGMMHDDSGEIPEGLQEAENPTYPVGDTVTIQTDHMAGMEGATATIDSAEETTVYMLDYQPTDGGEMVKNHKWVTEDELSQE